ncbi:MAG: HupE/UreJ family protein [Gammaproteobacteria bacterium]|nr:HupE/UreJ family protein [Gammaproteobacteria bacterium]MCP5135674.1 HupE/UreJ family protein [Gammaproteobacteria bacterium]
MNFRVAIGLWLAPGVALAHGGFGQGTPFFSGVMHVLMSVSVLLPLIAVGLLASQQGRIVLPRAQVLLPGSMALGAGLALSGVDSSVLIVVGQLAVIVVGVLVAVAASLHVRLVMALIALVGALCGYALMRADAPDSAVVWFVAGTMLGTMIVQGGAAMLALSARADWARIGVRVAGSWIAAIEVIYLGFSLA